MELTFCLLRSMKIVHQQTRLTLRAHYAQLRQAAQVLNSEQPHLDQNSTQMTMGWSDRIEMCQKGPHGTDSIVVPVVACMGESHRSVPNQTNAAHNSSRQSMIECLWIESPNAYDQMRFTLIRQENCNSKKPGQRPSMTCDSVPQGRLSRSEWRTVDPVAQRPSLFNKPSSDIHAGQSEQRRIPRGG